ncbi:MAG: amidohydrolase family protein [Opitutaceae bacterium]|nr:amidohydrolase family protein [Opitutaceae bacterium]
MNVREPSIGVVPAAPKAGAPPAARETGWLPDCVYTGDKFESGLAFFADTLGRITRFSREPADLAVAKRLAGQAALPGLVNGHSQAWQRVLRGRQRTQAGHDPLVLAAGRLAVADLYDAARMAFMEMLLSGITCVGEFHLLHHQPDGTSWSEPNFLSHEILRAARDCGLRVALFKVACAGFRQPPDPGQARSLTPVAEQYLREVDALREFVARNHPGDDAWVGVALHSLHSMPLDYLKTVAAYAHAQRLRLHVPVSAQPADNEACVAEHGRTPVALLAELGLLDKRFTAVHARHLTDDEVRLLGVARATVCACPNAEPGRGGAAPADKLLAAGAALALGTDRQGRINLLEDARLFADALHRPGGPAAGLAGLLLQVATTAGARSLGAPSGALEVGRPADFFTVNLYDPSIAGAEPDTLLDHVVFSLERRAIREVWVGAHQRVANGRHPYQGAIVSRFVELQRKLWGDSRAAGAMA